MKNTKRTIFKYEIYECKAVEEYLEKMAQKGWLLESTKGALFKFKKIKPRVIKYSVDVLDKISIFDHKDSDEALEYREYCKAAGWNYICQDKKVQIFYTEEGKEAVSIHTDEKEKFQVVFKSSIYSEASRLLLVILWLLSLHSCLWDTVGYTLSSNIGILSVLAIASGIVIFGIEFISFILWVIKTRRNLKENKAIIYNSYKELRIKNNVKKIYILMMLIFIVRFLIFENCRGKIISIFFLSFIIIITILSIGIGSFIDKRKYSKKANIIISTTTFVGLIVLTMMFVGGFAAWSINHDSQDKINYEKAPLTLIDFGYKQEDNEKPYFDWQKSILAERTKYYHSIGKDGLDYTVLQSQYSWIIRFYEKRLVSWLYKCNVDLKLKNTKLPKSIKVYADSKKRIFVLVSKDKVVDIRKDLINIGEDEFLDVVYKKVFKFLYW